MATQLSEGESASAHQAGTAIPHQYKDLLEKERLTDEANGRAWLDISGATAIDLDVSVLTYGAGNTLRSQEGNTDEQNEGYVGGEE